MANDVLSIELEIKDGNAEVVIGKSRKLLSDFVQDVNKSEPKIKFSVAGESYINLDKLEKRAEQTRKSFADIAAVRLDSGQIGVFTREILTAQTRSHQLSADIANIRKEINSPNRTSSIAFLTSELKAAEREAESLNRKLQVIRPPQTASGRTTGRRGGLGEFNRAVLEVADDFVPAGFNRPFNAASKEFLKITELSAATLGTFGAIAAVGYGIVQITKNIREEAERRLKAEDSISAAINRQILGQQEALKNLQKLRDDATSNRDFSKFLQSATTNQLDNRIKYFESLSKLIPETLPAIENGKNVQKSNPDFEKNTQQLLAAEAQRNATVSKNQQTADAFFSQRNEDFKKSQESAFQAAERRNEEFRKSVEKAKNTVKELGKTYSDTFDSLLLKSGASNPFVLIASDGDKAFKDLKTNLRGLPNELQSAAAEIQRKVNFRQLLEAQTNNKLAVLDLKNEANNFRNPFDADAQKKNQDDFINKFLFNNPNYLFLQNKSFVDDAERQNILKRFAPSAFLENPADRFNQFLTEKANTLYQPNQSPEQQSVNDKKLIGLTSGVNPLDLTRNLRESAASAREREADRLTKLEEQARKDREADRRTQEKLAGAIEKLAKIAEKDGFGAIEKQLQITVKDDTRGGADFSFLPRSPTSNDTKNTYSGGTFYDQYENNR